MGLRFDYIFAERAETDLDETVAYISGELCNTKAAQDFYNEVFKQIDNICSFPESGEPVDNEYVRDKDIRKVLVDNYVLFYKPNKDKKVIFIVRIVYGRRNLDEIIRSINLSQI